MAPRIRITRKKRGNIPKPPKGPTQVHVGFPAGKADSDVVARAIWNHYGTSRGIPARPFLFNAIRKNRKNISRYLESVAPQILQGVLTPDVALSRLGILTQGYIQDEITTMRKPPNDPSTIKAKGSSNPLIDTGEMRGAVTYEVQS